MSLVFPFSTSFSIAPQVTSYARVNGRLRTGFADTTPTFGSTRPPNSLVKSEKYKFLERPKARAETLLPRTPMIKVGLRPSRSLTLAQNMLVKNSPKVKRATFKDAYPAACASRFGPSGTNDCIMKNTYGKIVVHARASLKRNKSIFERIQPFYIHSLLKHFALT